MNKLMSLKNETLLLGTKVNKVNLEKSRSPPAHSKKIAYLHQQFTVTEESEDKLTVQNSNKHLHNNLA